MLAYRHMFHAGNFADVFKHAALVQLAILVGRKDKPFLYLDTHAGIGRYDLAHAWAQKNREFEQGIGRIFDRNDCPETVRPYLDAVRKCNPGGKLRIYPGSPLLVHQLMRETDRMVLVDLGREDYERLQKEFEGERRVQVRNMDGYQALKACLPPAERRALVLIDSPFDRKDEFRRLSDALVDAHRRFATGVYAVWYPLMDAKSVAGFEQSVSSKGIRKVLKLELSVRSASGQQGLRGSAMLIINPPYGFDSLAAPMLHWLWAALSPGGEGRYSVKWLVGE
jgi:23S rRNA (adenine2030-N6)-methyltransferase